MEYFDIDVFRCTVSGLRIGYIYTHTYMYTCACTCAYIYNLYIYDFIFHYIQLTSTKFKILYGNKMSQMMNLSFNVLKKKNPT